MKTKQAIIKALIGVLALSAVPSSAYADSWRKRGDDCDRGGYHYSDYHQGGHFQNHYGWNRYPRPRDTNSYGYRPDSAIQYGIRSGQLSDREVHELRADLNNIRREQAEYWSDGRLTNREREDLRHDENEYRKDLQHELNDGERRQSSGWWGW